MAATLMKVTVERLDGSRDTYPVLPKTQVAFERHFNLGLAQAQETGRTEYVYWLAWDAERLTGRVIKPFDTWLDDVAAVEAEEEAAPLGTPSPSPAG